jgi:hypothetical protein
LKSDKNLQKQLYSYPVVGRFGLGHSLLAWARCVVWSADHGAQRIAPQWLQPRIGPYLRREIDKRFYHGLFRSGSQIGGSKRLFLLATAKKVKIENWQMAHDFIGPTIVVFENLKTKNEATFLKDILGRSVMVRDALVDMTRPKALPPVTPFAHLAIHVRGGDFTVVKDKALYSTGVHNLRLPSYWYVSMLSELRKNLGFNLPAIIYSDCSDFELRELMSMENVKRAKKAGAVTDMLAMASAPVMISSGSGFSRWGSYLGQVPRICFPGQRAYRVLEPNIGVELEPECESSIPQSFISHIKSSIANVSRETP